MVHNGWEVAVFARELERERMREAAVERALAEAGNRGSGAPALRSGFAVGRLLRMLRTRLASTPEPSAASGERPRLSARPVIRMEQYASQTRQAPRTVNPFDRLVAAGGTAVNPAQRSA